MLIECGQQTNKVEGGETVSKSGMEMELHNLCAHQAKLSAPATPPPETLTPFLEETLPPTHCELEQICICFSGAHLPKYCFHPHATPCHILTAVAHTKRLRFHLLPCLLQLPPLVPPCSPFRTRCVFLGCLN